MRDDVGMQENDTTPVTGSVTRRTRFGDEALMQAWVRAEPHWRGTLPGLPRHRLGALGRPRNRLAHAVPIRLPTSLEHWESSAERKRWLASGGELVEDTRREHRTGIEGWVRRADLRRDLPGRTDAEQLRFHHYNMVIGAHTLHGVGYAMGQARDAAADPWPTPVSR